MAAPLRSFIKELNRHTILNTIRTSGLISRIDLSRATGLSQALITGITADLTQEGLIEEKKSGAYEGGRRPKLLSIRPDGAFVIGVDLSLHRIHVVIMNLEAEIKADNTLELSGTDHDEDEIIDLTARAIQECVWNSKFSRDQISGVGIGIPGLVDSDSGVIRYMPNYEWADVAFRNKLQKKINLPTYIDNSSNNLACTELWFDDGDGKDDFVVITIETGVGSGVVINGQLTRGFLGIAGEFGHITVDPNGPLCRCGKKGCVEAFCGNNSIIRDVKEACEREQIDFADPDSIIFEDIIEKMESHKDVLEKIYERAGKMLGMGIAHLISVINPKKIIITGKGVKAGDLLFTPMYESVDQHISEKFGNYGTQIIVKDWTKDDWAKGAGTLVLTEIYKSPVEK